MKFTLLILLTFTVVNCQFFYNYEDGQDDNDYQPERQDSTSFHHQNNAEPAINRQRTHPSENTETSTNNNRGKARIRIRNHQSGELPESIQGADIDRRAMRQERRQARRREREMLLVQPPTPITYSPSVFENVALGEAPRGVYIPHDSLLNVLKSPSRTSYVQPSVVPSTDVQPVVNYLNNQPRQEFFVQPPALEEYSQPNLILPVTRGRSVGNYGQNSVPAAEPVVQTTRRESQRPPHQEMSVNPVVDIDSYRPSLDDVIREPIQVVPQVKYVSATDSSPRTRHTTNRNRQLINYQQTTIKPRVYSPSAFESIPLGEAPSGVYVPEDSLLNVLRDPSLGYNTPSRQIQRRQSSVQPIYNHVAENNYLPEVFEEPEEESPVPPPPPTPPRRSPHRSTQVQTSRRSSRRQHQTEVQNEEITQLASPSNWGRNRRRNEETHPPAAPSNRGRNQRRNEDYEDYQRVQPQVRTDTPRSSRRRIETTTRQETQPSNRERSFRKAKLAIAELPLDTDDDGIPGEAGVNYPVFHVIPKTSFSCSQQEHNGYYADLETSCQVVHLCQAGGVQDSFLCPNGTIFSQEKFSCQWWYKVNCNDAPKFYIKNDELYKIPEKEERKRN